MKTYSVKQIAKMLQTNPETVRRWIRDDKLKAEQVSRKGGNVVTEAELKRFIKATPKYLAKFTAAAGLAAVSPIAGIGFLAGGFWASAILGCCEEKSKVDVRIREEEFKEYLKNKVIKLKLEANQRRKLIEKAETEIEEISWQIEQYTYLLDHEDAMLEMLNNVNIKKGDG